MVIINKTYFPYEKEFYEYAEYLRRNHKPLNYKNLRKGTTGLNLIKPDIESVIVVREGRVARGLLVPYIYIP